MTAPPASVRCSQCGSEIAATLLSCPACHRLVHGERLSALALQAKDAEAVGDLANALAQWREALDLLPRQSQQYRAITARVETLGRQVDHLPAASRPSPTRGAPHRPHTSTVAKTAAGIGAAALLLWKFKFLLTFILTKGKLLLLGLTKTSTLFSMFLSMGVYWAAWGWKFALGLVLSIYVHEMGHVAELRRRGFKATAPMFIPGLGAVIRLKQHTSNAHEDARIGLAGPIWGLGAALASLGIFLATGAPIWAAIAKVGAWINLFNLLPVWQLDGGRGWRALSTRQAWIVVGAVAVAWFLTSEGLLALILLVAAVRTMAAKQESPEGDVLATTQFIMLIASLSALSKLPVPGGAAP